MGSDSILKMDPAHPGQPPGGKQPPDRLVEELINNDEGNEGIEDAPVENQEVIKKNSGTLKKNSEEKNSESKKKTTSTSENENQRQHPRSSKRQERESYAKITRQSEDLHKQRLSEGYYQKMQNNGEVLKLQIHLERANRSVSYALTNSELGALVKGLKVPKGAYLGNNDANEEGGLTVMLKPDTDLNAMNLSVSIELRYKKLRTRPICAIPRAELVKISRVPENLGDDEILEILGYFGKQEAEMQVGTVEPRIGETDPNILAIKGSLKWSERIVLMSLVENIPSKIMVGFHELNVVYASQKRTCARCKKSYTECIGEGNAKLCEKRGGPRVELPEVWDRFMESLKKPVICIPTENLGGNSQVDYIECRGLPVDYTKQQFIEQAGNFALGIAEDSLLDSNAPGVFRIDFKDVSNAQDELQSILEDMHGQSFTYMGQSKNARGMMENKLRNYTIRCTPITMLNKNKVNEVVQEVVNLTAESEGGEEEAETEKTVDIVSTTDSEDRDLALENHLSKTPDRSFSEGELASGSGAGAKAPTLPNSQGKFIPNNEGEAGPSTERPISNTLLVRAQHVLRNKTPGPAGPKARVLYGPTGQPRVVMAEMNPEVQDEIRLSPHSALDVSISPGDLANCDAIELSETIAAKNAAKKLPTTVEDTEDEDEPSNKILNEDGLVEEVQPQRKKQVARKSTGAGLTKKKKGPPPGARKRKQAPHSSGSDYSDNNYRRSSRIVVKKSKPDDKTGNGSSAGQQPPKGGEGSSTQ